VTPNILSFITILIQDVESKLCAKPKKNMVLIFQWVRKFRTGAMEANNVQEIIHSRDNSIITPL